MGLGEYVVPLGHLMMVDSPRDVSQISQVDLTMRNTIDWIDEVLEST